MTKKNQNFEIFSGETKLLKVTVTDAVGSPFNLTGATITWQLKTSTGSISKSTPTGITITDAVNGKFTITLDAVDTNTFLSGSYLHESQVTEAGGAISTVLSGTVTINDSLFN